MDKIQKEFGSEVAWLWTIIVVDIAFLFFSASGLSISYKEALILYEAKTPLHYLVKGSCYLFGNNDFGLRVPFIAIHVINVLLIYSISKPQLKNKIDRLMCVLVYVMLPGINTAALVVNEASLAIFITLLFVWCWQNRLYLHSYLILLVSLGIDNSFAIFYLALFFYGVAKKQKTLFILCLILFSASMYIYGFHTHGRPRGYFLDTIGVYAATLSPLLLLYYIYTLYRIAIKEKKHILWFISFGAFIFTLIFSLRQRLALEDFLPFAVIAVPLMMRVFLNSYRVRLPRHRKLHKIILGIVLGSLILNFLLIIANKSLYIFYKTPSKHFAYKYNVAKELAAWLHVKGVDKIYIDDSKMRLRLKFYGISSGNKYELKKLDLDSNDKDIFKLNFAFKPISRYKIISFDQENMVK